MASEFPSVICKKCGWVHFGVPRAYVDEQNKIMLTYMKSISWQVRKKCYGFSKMKDYKPYNYERCFFCSGPYKNFRKAKKAEIPYGSTIQPILHYKET